MNRMLSSALPMLVALAAGCTQVSETWNPLAFMDFTGRAVTLQPLETGQVTLYAARDDGDLEMGMPWPALRFTDNGDGTVTDNLTGLIWIQNGNVMPAAAPGFDTDDVFDDGRVTWQHALDFVVFLNGIPYAGRGDWRLPNYNELRSLLNYERPQVAPWLNASGFVNVSLASAYHSGTTNPFFPADSFTVNYINGGHFAITKNNYSMVLAVRGRSNVVPATGQTSCYDAGGAIVACAGTGQDGEYRAGARWPATRFTDNGDGTVTDHLTGLMWEQDAGGTATSWANALVYADNLNGVSFAGHTDWRLPNVCELQSLWIFGAAGPTIATWLNGSGFQNVVIGSYHSSTTYADGTAWNWSVQFSNGEVGYGDKGNVNNVWAVRGGR